MITSMNHWGKNGVASTAPAYRNPKTTGAAMPMKGPPPIFMGRNMHVKHTHAQYINHL